MAAVFTLVTVVAATALLLGARAYLRFGRRRSWTRNPYLPLLISAIVLCTYLLAKIAYEELYPCLTVDDLYCDFASTQHHNLFGWEF